MDMENNPNLIEIRSWAEGEDTGGWPAPPEYTEYRVEGRMRLDVLHRVGRGADDPAVVRLVQGVIEGGWSEYTVEHDYTIEVWIDDLEGKQSQRVFDGDAVWRDDCLPAFLRWLENKEG